MQQKKRDNREGQILGERRIELGLTQEDVAFEAGMSLQQYQRFEYGERDICRTSMKMGLSICAVLGSDPFLLVSGQNYSLVGIFRER